MYPVNLPKIYEYDLTGHLIKEIPLAFGESAGDVNIDYEKRIMLVAQIYYSSVSANYTSGPPLWIQDFDGNVLWKVYDPIEVMHGSFANKLVIFKRNPDGLEITYNKYDAISDTSYYVDMRERRVIPLFTATFDGQVPRHQYLRIGRYYLVIPSNFIGASSEWDIGDRMVILDSKTLRGGYCEVYNDFLGGIKLDIAAYLANYEGQYSYVLDPGELSEKVEERLKVVDLKDEDRVYLNALLESIDPDDNNYVALGNHK